MNVRRLRLAIILATFAVFLGGAPLAAIAEEPDADLVAAVQAAERNDFETAIRLLDALVRRDGFNSDAYAWLEYAVRRKAELEQ